MTQEDKELLLKYICMALPYGIKVRNVKNEFDIYDFNHNVKEIKTLIEEYNIKPYLRPMSSMTDEEAKEIAILHDIKDILSVKVTSDYIDIIVDDGVCSTERRTIWYDEIVSSIECLYWLLEHHFDFIGLIPKGLAIEVTKENNPYKE